ncbi:hypothetical protein HNR42_000632 [Deinobacterium chartae]|uniref:Uncharacterized protein n=1 Tax=Deinobacterium chartae TaxID=521158 RepID=A0A841HZ21_9DEIO|nr:hypothetical protein [Deinobacterium chartae]MBB6097218.1 hypothetical protein [Deinobacterium chartae]
MPFSRPLMFSLAAAVAVAAVTAALLARTDPATYCLERPGYLLGGAAGPVPDGYRQSCPQGGTTREEVRAGRLRIEQYEVQGRKFRELRDHLIDQGLVPRTDDQLSPTYYTSLMRHGLAPVLYEATLEGDRTVILLGF